MINKGAINKGAVTRAVVKVAIRAGLFVCVGVAGVRSWGWFDGLALVAALYLVMPWEPVTP